MNPRIRHLQEINKAWTLYADDKNIYNALNVIEKLKAYRRWREQSDYFKIPEIPAEVPTR